MATLAKTLTYEEWLTMPAVEDGTDEVVKGEVHFMPPAKFAHAETLRRLNRLLDRSLNENECAVYDSNFGVLISRQPLVCRPPDLAAFQLAGMKIEDGLFVSPPDLVVEILSPSENRSRKEGKMEDYAALGVPEAWIVSPEAQVVEIRLLREGKLERTAILAEGSLQPTRFPGVSIPLVNLWPEK